MSTATGGGTNPFALFDLPPGFDLDLGELESSFHALQKIHHPDRAKSADEGAHISALLNESYRTLRSPSGRARCLLQTMGVTVTEDTAASLDTAFLQDEFDLRARLQQADTPAELEVLRELARARAQSASKRFAESWRQQQLDVAEQDYYRMLFSDRFLAAINEREDQLLDQEAL